MGSEGSRGAAGVHEQIDLRRFPRRLIAERDDLALEAVTLEPLIVVRTTYGDSASVCNPNATQPPSLIGGHFNYGSLTLHRTSATRSATP